MGIEGIMPTNGDLFTLDSKGFGFAANIGWIPSVIILLAILTYLMWIRRAKWDIQEQEINVFGQKVKIKPNFDVARIAHKAWTELSSRKAALLFEEDDDVVVEVYDSWYALFGEIRALVKEIPAEKIRTDPEVRKLIRLLIDTLNVGLRPHLTRYQSNFRKWFDTESKKEHKDGLYRSPQEIQRDFPRYIELVGDLKRINGELIIYAASLADIAHGKDGL
jgi:hypothetical protein